ncbi:VOC family protein [Pendulispora brunnea]|uniref:VOC family protein n=1 Tax=Pendulispora brunnea TaxID=2905690 RepID=A0ABZ2KMC8_9BACT
MNPAAVHSLRRFALSVPDLGQAEHFYRCFGLDVVPLERGGLSVRTAAHGREVARMHHGPRKTLHHLSFGAFAGDVDRIAAQALEAGARELESPAEGEPGRWFVDPDGRLFHVTEDENRSPKGRSTEELIVHVGPNAAPERNLEVRPRRLGHVMLLTADAGRTANFYVRALGLRLSDATEGIVSFLHHPHGSDHHVLAFVQSSGPAAFHHASFEVPTVDAVGIGANRMAEHGYKQGWGLGRHYAGSNFFHYVRDPWGSFVEYFCDMDYIPAGTPWEPRKVAPENSLSSWGPDVPDYFLVNSEA